MSKLRRELMLPEMAKRIDSPVERRYLKWRIGEDELITQLLLELSLSKVRQGMSWDVQTDLDDFAALLLNENDRIPLADLKEKDRQSHRKDQEQLKNTLKETQDRIKKPNVSRETGLKQAAQDV